MAKATASRLAAWAFPSRGCSCRGGRGRSADSAASAPPSSAFPSLDRPEPFVSDSVRCSCADYLRNVHLHVRHSEETGVSLDKKSPFSQLLQWLDQRRIRCFRIEPAA